MPGRYCAVISCGNCQLALKAAGKTDIIFHCFPLAKDLASTTIQKKWITCCKRSDKFNPKNAWICSDHFTKDDYERDLQNELLGLPLRRKLKKTAVPSVNLGTITQEIKEIKEDSPEVTQLQPKILLHTLKFGSPKPSTSKSLIVETISKPSEASSDQHETNTPSSSNPRTFSKNLQHETNTPSSSNPRTFSKNLQRDNVNFKEKYEKLLEKHNTLKLESRNKIKNLNNLMNYYKSRYYKNPIKKSAKTQIAEEILNMILTKNQIDLLSERRKKVFWTREEILVAFTLMYYSKKCYVYLRDKLKYPLPALSSLRRWAAHMDVSQGVLNDILMMMNLAGEDLTKLERVVVLQCGEVEVESIEEYDTVKDQVLGPYNKMQIIEARGLFSKWKQLVYIAFDQKITKEILIKIIKELHSISYHVVACVTDCGDDSVDLWRELEVDTETCFFSHPDTNKNIYMFADARHILTLLRDCLLDTGFLLEGEIIVTKEPLQKLIELENEVVDPPWEINQNHLDCEGSQRQNVRLATELLSHSIAEALYHYKPSSDQQMCEYLSEFIDTVDQWFDIFNSFTKEGRVPFKSAFGVHLEEQEAHLSKMDDIVTSMRVIGKDSLENFQMGVIMSNKSLKLLFQDVKKDYKVKYIYTHKLTQDSLETFSSQLRGAGLNEPPSPITAIHRIRMIISGKNAGTVEANVNRNDSPPEEYMTPKIFRRVKIDTDQEEINDMSLDSDSDSSFSSSSSLETSISKPSASDTASSEMTNDVLEYIAGWLANKYQKVFPSLGYYTYQIKLDDHNYYDVVHEYNIPPWVQKLELGDIIKPTEEWLAKVKNWEKQFTEHHSNGFKKGPGVIKQLAQNISKKEDQLPLEMILEFCRVRTLIKINYNNIHGNQKQNLKRKNVSSNLKLTSKVRKYNKIVN